MARGNQGRDIYADKRDRKLWLVMLGEACEKTGWRIHAWVMMNNHYHLLLTRAALSTGGRAKAPISYQSVFMSNAAQGGA